MSELDLAPIEARYARALDAKPSKGEWVDVAIPILCDSVADVKPLVAEVERLRRQIDTVKKIHEPEEYENPNTYETGYMCSHCYQENGEWAEYPCETLRALGVGG